MSAVDIMSVWKQFAAKKAAQEDTNAERETLILHYVHMCKITVGRLAYPNISQPDRDDLESNAVMGLIRAVDNFQLERGVKFETYAITLIRGAVLESMRNTDWVPRLVRENKRNLERAMSELENKLARTATEAEICDYLHITEAQLAKMLTDIGRSATLSLDELTRDSHDTFLDRIICDGPTPFQTLEAVERKRLLREGIVALPEREQLVLALYYTERLTFREVGEAMQISESRAYQLHAQGALRLKTRLAPVQDLLEARG